MNRTTSRRLLAAGLLWCLAIPFTAFPGPLPPYPLMTTRVQPSPSETDKAVQLFFLACRENRRLRWDACLSRKAFKRAKEMVEKGYFGHEDPRTGENPVWEKVTQCGRYRYASENLIQGNESAGACHQALMESSAHRANLISRNHHLLGVGCYDQVCVELFAGW